VPDGQIEWLLSNWLKEELDAKKRFASNFRKKTFTRQFGSQFVRFFDSRIEHPTLELYGQTHTLSGSVSRPI
jgi:hypothetical protein